MNIFQPILDIFFRTYGSKTLICALQKVVKDGLADCQWELSRVLYHTIFVPYLEEYRSRVGRLVKRMFKQAVITMFLLLSAKLVLSVMQTRDVSIVQKRNLQTASRQPMFPVLRTVSILNYVNKHLRRTALIWAWVLYITVISARMPYVFAIPLATMLSVSNMCCQANRPGSHFIRIWYIKLSS